MMKSPRKKARRSVVRRKRIIYYALQFFIEEEWTSCFSRKSNYKGSETDGKSERTVRDVGTLSVQKNVGRV
jgi:hypothetical protein